MADRTAYYRKWYAANREAIAARRRAKRAKQKPRPRPRRPAMTGSMRTTLACPACQQPLLAYCPSCRGRKGGRKTKTRRDG